MLSFKNKQAAKFVLGIFLLVVAVPGQAICTCDHATASCCGEQPDPVEEQGCCSSTQQWDDSSLPSAGCSMDPVPSGRMADTDSCMHVKVLPASTMTTSLDVNPDSSSGSFKTACGSIESSPEIDVRSPAVSPGPVSTRVLAPPAPVYLLVSSLII